MFSAFVVAVIFALGFGAGRVKHPANLKVSAVKAELAKLEVEAALEYSAVLVEVRAKTAAIVARIKALL